jgi:hypothetical protein
MINVGSSVLKAMFKLIIYLLPVGKRKSEQNYLCSFCSRRCAQYHHIEQESVNVLVVES